ncbi:helix-turn-helix transcriptional regulator [Microvirga sp. STS03]|uniref:helix-turn-helix domain-containing protein n=1 Tax=Pontibacter TaxID=323449 RepID=UPI001B819DB1|nr:helix-turn-helix transcriptional regulator [Pontibacter populi]MBR0571924.1 helix-turn-helix transcriptional regulator [Microvirga sp. STS03]
MGENIRLLRLSKGLSQEEIAYAADIPINQIGRIERGEINATVSTLYVISKALDVPLTSLVSVEEQS